MQVLRLNNCNCVIRLYLGSKHNFIYSPINQQKTNLKNGNIRKSRSKTNVS